MQNLSSSLNALFRRTKVANYPLYSIETKVMFGSVTGHFANLRHLKRCKTCFWLECTISVYQSWEASILVHWTLNDVWKCFGALCYPLTRKVAKLVSEPQCTILGYRSCEASILLHWTENGVWECFEAFRWPLARKRCKTWVRALMHYFGVPKLRIIHSTPLESKWCLGLFRGISLTFGT
jgi:hypothetical protein